MAALVLFLVLSLAIGVIPGIVLGSGIRSHGRLNPWWIVIGILSTIGIATLIFKLTEIGGWFAIFALWVLSGAILSLWGSAIVWIRYGIRIRYALAFALVTSIGLCLSFELGNMRTADVLARCAVEKVVQAAEKYREVYGSYPKDFTTLNDPTARVKHPVSLAPCTHKGQTASISSIRYLYHRNVEDYEVRYASPLILVHMRYVCRTMLQEPTIRCRITPGPMYLEHYISSQ
jgi:hypothetical protein